MNKKTLIILAVHGDEAFSFSVIKKLAKLYGFDWLVANPKAMKNNTRFIESDLNRSGPGKATGTYEERRALKIIRKAKNYDRVIDIHGTVSNSGLFVIVTNPDWNNIELAKQIRLKNVVLWPGLRETGPLTQYIPNSVEIECGPKDNAKTAKRLEIVLRDFFENRKFRMQNFYIVTGNLSTKRKLEIEDFQKACFKGKSFYPLLVKKNKGTYCYIMQKLRDTLYFNK